VTVTIDTARFTLRELTASDVSERYLSWFADPQARVSISAAAVTKGIADLREYVTQRCDREDVLFLGIFDKASGAHIGNVKYEPVDSARGYAIMGILIGDPTFRGKGVATEVLTASGHWLKTHRQIGAIMLGVDRDNLGAIRAYEKVGYRVADTPHIPLTGTNAITMVWSL
jgi:[ribosomal protein S5]-alanine N-acetyltransferase